MSWSIGYTSSKISDSELGGKQENLITNYFIVIKKYSQNNSKLVE